MNEKESFERYVPDNKITFKAVPVIWIITIIVGIILMFFNKDWAFTYVLGAATSMLGLSMMIKAANRCKPEYLKQTMVKNYFIRYAMYAVVIGFTYFSFELSALLFLALGLTSVKIVLMIFILLHKGEKV